jgi:hypothetical protein
MSQPKHFRFRPGILQLESREVPAISSVRSLGGVVTVQANNGATTVLVFNTGSTILVQDVGLNKFWGFAPSQVGRVDVIGGNANDTFTVRGNVRVRMMGNGGSDTFYGGTGRDIMLGGPGADSLYGRNGDDHLDGGEGHDYLHGGNGNDVLLGGDGNDQLNGTQGADAISGDDGRDVLIAIDGGTTDRVDGGGGFDIIWVDLNGTVTDTQTGIDGVDFINQVASFTNAGADRTLNGDRIADPTLLPNNDVYERFADRPLFSSQGPDVEDFNQGQLGDCWFLAALASTAEADADIIRSRVANFGDGTYGVRYQAADGSDRFYRVDDDLPVKVAGNTFLEYTAVGVDNSMWVAIMEKAYTHHRVPGANSYGSIEGGFSFDAFPHLGLTPSRVFFNPTTNLSVMSNTIKQMIGPPLTAGTVGIDAVPAGVPLIAAHQYVLLGYELDAITGLVGKVFLRNPWGVDGPGSSPGPSNDNNFEDAIVTVTLDQLRSCMGSFEWAPVT